MSASHAVGQASPSTAHLARRATSTLQRACACGQHAGNGGECEACRQKRSGTLQRAAVSTAGGAAAAPPIVHDVLRSPGQPLDATTRAYMEPRFGHDFSHVRIHADDRAAASVQAVDALAWTVGNHIAFDTGQYRPGNTDGRRLLVHEITHTVQQRDGAVPANLTVGGKSEPAELEAHLASGQIDTGQNPTPAPSNRSPVALRRFEKSERSSIGKYADVLDTAKGIAARSERDGRVDANTLVQEAGGFNLGDKINKIAGSERDATPLPNRYLLTCRCGLIDMRHFYQMMYISRFYQIMLVAQGVRDPASLRDMSNKASTQEGRKHELDSEATSRFAPEDTPSNALGALLGTDISIWSSPEALLAKLGILLNSCTPVSFISLPAAEQNTAVDYYGNRGPGGMPSNQNETAIPTVLSLSLCGSDRSLPFGLDPKDSDRKTLTNEPFSLNDDTEIRNWVSKNSDGTIRALPSTEKIRQINRLLDGWVSDDDMTAIEKICGSVTSASEMKEINRAVHRREGELNNDEDKKRLHIAVQRGLS